MQPTPRKKVKREEKDKLQFQINGDINKLPDVIRLSLLKINSGITSFLLQTLNEIIMFVTTGKGNKEELLKNCNQLKKIIEGVK